MFQCCNILFFSFNIFNCRFIIKLCWSNIFPFDYGCIRSTLYTQEYIMIDVPVFILQWRLKMTLAGCILMMCVLVRSYTTFQDLLHSHPYGCFFCNFWTLFTYTISKQFLNQRLVKLCAKTAICSLTLHWWIYHTLSWIQVLVLFQWQRVELYLFMLFVFQF